MTKIKYQLQNHIVDYTQHFGICNVNKRISNKEFGSGEITIESCLNEGTTITIKYAQMEGDN